jgi:hypothetical protein
MSVLTELAAKLAAVGLGTVDVDIFAFGEMPEDPDVCISLSPGGGIAPVMQMGSVGIGYETPSVQVVVRGAAYDSSGPYDRAMTAYRELAKVEATTLTGGGTSAFYHWIHPAQPPFLLRKDNTPRVYFAFNVLCEKAPA